MLFTIDLRDSLSAKIKQLQSGLMKFSQTGQQSGQTLTKALRAPQQGFSKLTQTAQQAARAMSGAAKQPRQSIQALQNHLQQLQQKRDQAFGTAQIRKYNRQIQKTEAQLRRLQNLPPPTLATRFRSATGALSGFLGVAGGLAAVSAGTRLLSSSLKAFDVQAKAEAQVLTVLKSTAGAAGKTFEELKQQASALQKQTLFGDEETLKAQALLLTFKQIKGQTFDRSIQAVQDVATAMGMDLKSASVQVGKALNDPATGLSMLTRVGITFFDKQKHAIKSLQETGDLAGAQAVILKELESQFQGSAEAAAKAGTGPFKQFKNALGDLQEEMDAGLVGTLNRIGTWGTDLLEKLAPLKQAFATLKSTLGGLFSNIWKVISQFFPFNKQLSGTENKVSLLTYATRGLSL